MSFQIPEDLSALSAEELDKALEEASNEFAPLGKKSDEEITDEEYQRMSELGAFAEAAKTAKDERAAAAAERSEKLNAMRQTMASKDEEEDKAPEGEEAPADEAPADEAPAEEAPADEAPVEEIPDVTEEVLPAEEVVVTEGEAPAAEEEILGEEVPSSEEVEEDDKEKEKDAVVASGKSSIAGTAKNAPKPEETPEAKAFSLTAAANISSVSAGKNFANLKEAAEAINGTLKSMPTGKDQYSRQGALVFRRDTSNMLSQESTRDDMELLLAAGSESRLQGGNLVAAGGWAAPSETLLDFCDIETADGLIDVPEVSITRGGINSTKGPDFESVLASATGFWDMTEAVAEAGTELKTSIRPEVPQFTETRLDAVGVMVEAGLLTRAGWPELVERYAKLALLAHEVKMHNKKIAGIQAFTGAAIPVPNGFGNALDVLHVIDVVAAGERQRYSLGNSATLEVLLPVWVRSVVRADLANRSGVDFLSVSDAQIDSFFSERKLRVQWLQHYQSLDTTTAGIATAYPETLEVIMYPAGTFVAGTSDVISLDTIYDSTNLKKNDYVHLFVEQGLAVVNPCHDGRRFSLPLNANGKTGAASIDTNLFRTPVVAP